MAHVVNIWVLGIWVTVILLQVLGEYMIIRYLDPQDEGVRFRV